MARCFICKKDSPLISAFLGLCVNCIRQDFDKAKPYIEKAHAQSRELFNLPATPPRDLNGERCNLCVNACQVKSEGGVGFCGLPLSSREDASLGWYYDGLPTNCVADWVCAGCSQTGYPEFSYSKGPEYGYKNLAVFYQACSFDCLFCQNWHFREADLSLSKKVQARSLAEKVDEKTSCICYFGGDPTPFVLHSIMAARIARSMSKKKVLRICWETNGSMSEQFLKQMLDIAIESGGCIKFDLKTWTENLNIALCGVTNKKTLDNFRLAASYIDKRQQPPLIVASTLLVPGYVDIYEVERIVNFIASINPNIPYSLLAFHPQFHMDDLPTTSRSHAETAREIAIKAGLKNIKIGNIHLLRDDYNEIQQQNELSKRNF